MNDKKSPRGIVYNSSLAKEKEKCTMFEMEKEQGTNHCLVKVNQSSPNHQVYDSIRTPDGKTILKLHREREKNE